MKLLECNFHLLSAEKQTQIINYLIATVNQLDSFAKNLPKQPQQEKQQNARTGNSKTG